MKLFLHELRAEQLLFWRNREAAFFTFFLPVIFFLIFASVYGNDRITKEGGIRAASFLEAGMIGYGVAATCFAGLGITLVIRRESGILKRVRATPVAAHGLAMDLQALPPRFAPGTVIARLQQNFSSTPKRKSPEYRIGILSRDAAQIFAGSARACDGKIERQT